ncbi:MAG: DUF1028 domain-containing protein [Bacteroidetes bacterium]|nr:MAG: DUF1028 domain-containing protein [Bacteroidota bacterium]
MRHYFISILLIGYTLFSQAQQPVGSTVSAGEGHTFFGAEPLAHTFSIVARDSVTGEMGVAVQSHWFSVGTVVSWGRAGVGVVATQSFVNKSFGPRGLALLERGLSPRAALDSLLASDPGREVRQVAILDTRGRVAAHTGEKCIQYACHQEGLAYSVQANMMLGPDVCNAMQQSMDRSGGKPLAERLILAMEAAQAVGGDFRGQQSAAVLVVPGKSTGRPWDDVLVDLRVDDHATPVAEIRRLYQVHLAYEHMNKGDYYVEVNDMPAAMQEYTAAQELLPGQAELQFWAALTLANVGQTDKALPMFRAVFAAEPIWRIVLPRLAAVGLVTMSAADLEQILRL